MIASMHLFNHKTMIIKPAVDINNFTLYIASEVSGQLLYRVALLVTFVNIMDYNILYDSV